VRSICLVGRGLGLVIFEFGSRDGGCIRAAVGMMGGRPWVVGTAGLVESCRIWLMRK